MKIKEDVRILYDIPAPKDRWGNTPVFVLLESVNGNRYVWITNKKTKGYIELSKDKNKHVPVTLYKSALLRGGDIKIEKLTI